MYKSIVAVSLWSENVPDVELLSSKDVFVCSGLAAVGFCQTLIRCSEVRLEEWSLETFPLEPVRNQSGNTIVSLSIMFKKNL